MIFLEHVKKFHKLLHMYLFFRMFKRNKTEKFSLRLKLQYTLLFLSFSLVFILNRGNCFFPDMLYTDKKLYIYISIYFSPSHKVQISV